MRGIYHLDALDRGGDGLGGDGGRAGEEEVLAERQADLLDLLGGITAGERRHVCWFCEWGR